MRCVPWNVTCTSCRFGKCFRPASTPCFCNASSALLHDSEEPLLYENTLALCPGNLPVTPLAWPGGGRQAPPAAHWTAVLKPCCLCPGVHRHRGAVGAGAALRRWRRGGRRAADRRASRLHGQPRCTFLGLYMIVQRGHRPSGFPRRMKQLLQHRSVSAATTQRCR
jgi:hypothetical protein